jgi:hypothetical protein
MALRAVPGLAKMTEEEKLGIPAYVIWKKLNAVFMLDRKTKGLETKEERDAYRGVTVREAFDELAESVKETGAGGCPAGSYLSSAVTCFETRRCTSGNSWTTATSHPTTQNPNAVFHSLQS